MLEPLREASDPWNRPFQERKAAGRGASCRGTPVQPRPASAIARVNQRQEGDVDTFFHHLHQRLRGDLDVAEDQHLLQLVVGHVEHDTVLVFQQEAVARLPQNGTLFGQIEIGHVSVSFFVLGSGTGDVTETRFQQSGFHRGLAARRAEPFEQFGRHGAGHSEDPALFAALVAPRGPDLVALEENTQEMQAELEIGDPGLGCVQFELELGQFLGDHAEGGGGLGFGAGEDHEIVGVSDQFPVPRRECAVQRHQEQVGEERRKRRALGQALVTGPQASPVPCRAPDPLGDQGE